MPRLAGGDLIRGMGVLDSHEQTVNIGVGALSSAGLGGPTRQFKNIVDAIAAATVRKIAFIATDAQ